MNGGVRKVGIGDGLGLLSAGGGFCRRAGGENQVDGGGGDGALVPRVEKTIEDSGCWKIDLTGDGGDGGFRNELTRRATMLGDGALTGFVPLLVEGVATSGLVGTSATRPHRKESSGRKHMQKRKK